MKYDGPPDKFDGLCPLCKRSPEEEAEAKRQDERDAQSDRGIREAYIQGHIND